MRLLAALVVSPVAVAALAPAAYAQDPLPIRPGQYFQGVVKGVQADAQVEVVCPGPIYPGRLGHPVAGQEVEVVPGSSSTAAGYTGSLGTSVVSAWGGTSSGAAQLMTFSSYYAPQDIPTGFWLPCGGSVKVPFSPQPTSPTAVTDYVTVTFVNIAV